MAKKKNDYNGLLNNVNELLENARRASARTLNALLTATYWEIGHRIVEFEQRGKSRAEYGQVLLGRLSEDLTQQYGRGFSERNLLLMRQFYISWPIPQTLSAESSNRARQLKSSDKTIVPDRVALLPETGLLKTASRFPLPWSAYVRLLSVDNEYARAFYETEAIRGGWSVRQLDRQISSQFYERTALSRDKAAMLTKGGKPKTEDIMLPEEEIKDPFILEFLDLKDEYSEHELEEALIRHLESFLLELGSDFAFIARQKRLRIGDEWYRIDLLFFHRRLKCLVVIDLKLSKFTPADAGQMHMYLNYAKKHWTHPDENPPVGLILCAKKNDVLAKYALEGLPNKVLASRYHTTLPDEKQLVNELMKTRKLLEQRKKPSQ
jgi:predicted nuclease of restriction endonuclease-like (RecB) superfamily